MTELLQRAFELVSQLPAEEQDAIAAQLLEEVQSAAVDPSDETLETFLGGGLNRPGPTPEEMEELRVLAEKEPGLADVLSLAEDGGLDVDTILAIRNAG